MANYCANTLTVKGSPKELNIFRTAVWKSEVEPLDFSSTVPMPIELEKTESPNQSKPIIKSILRAKYGYDNWYDWQLNNWGCKWGPYNGIRDPKEKEYKNGNESLVYDFDTPWSPPTEWIVNTSKLFPTLTFKNYCNEPGCNFKGTQIIINGIITKDTIK